MKFLCSILGGALVLVALTGCSVRKWAVNRVSDALAGGASAVVSADDDPELIRNAAPFNLKLIETLLAESPRHRGLLLAAASGFTQYSFAFIQEDADEIESHDLARAQELRNRARRMYLRARGYGLRGLELRYRNFGETLRRDPQLAVAQVRRKDDVPFLYWTAVAWGTTIALSKDQPEVVAQQPVVEALIDRAYGLDPNYENGALENFLMIYELARPGGQAEAVTRARQHYDRAVELTGGQAAGPFVTWAESVCVQQQNRKEFESLLKRALAINPDEHLETRLVNLMVQRRARWLLSRMDDLFVE
jgi:predicted anti-sigma-YlaC factor YlaD